jgi:arginase
MKKKSALTVIGVPSSAGAYSPGQEKAPQALREAGLIELLKKKFTVQDKGNINGFRWKPDRSNHRAMNAKAVASVAQDLRQQLTPLLDGEDKILVLGGDCTIELGCVSAAQEKSKNAGLLYIDLDTDLNTPVSVVDGALDWMGVAHMLNIKGCVSEVANVSGNKPMLTPEQICFFAAGNITEFEKAIIKDRKIVLFHIDEVAADPILAAKRVCVEWAKKFDSILIHCDTDVLNFHDIPLAENYRRDAGLTLDQLMRALSEILKLPNWKILTVTEINPDHGEIDGATLRLFSEKFADALGEGLQ